MSFTPPPVSGLKGGRRRAVVAGRGRRARAAEPEVANSAFGAGPRAVRKTFFRAALGRLATNWVINRIQTWALEEARRRLEAEGILEDPNPKK